MTIHSLNSQRIDLKGRLDQRVEVDPTGIPSLDLALGGGLQPGRGLLISGMSGSGKSSLLLKFAYLFARTGSQVLFSQPGLEAAEILARLGARALHRNYRNATATFGTVLSGLALQDENYRGPVNDSLDQVFEKIGERLFLHEAKAYQSLDELLRESTRMAMTRGRTILCIDGIEYYQAMRPETAHRGAIAEIRDYLRAGGSLVITSAENEAEDWADAVDAWLAIEEYSELLGSEPGSHRKRTKSKTRVKNHLDESEDSVVSRDTVPEEPLEGKIRQITLALRKNRFGPRLNIDAEFDTSASIIRERGTAL